MAIRPRSIGTPSMLSFTPAVKRIISDAEEPRAISVKLAIVGFQNNFSTYIR